MNPTEPQQGTRHEPGLELAPEVRAGLRERDPAALAAFFDAYFERVHGYVRRLVRDEHVAEDLTQEIFLHVHRALPTYDPSRDLRPWIFTIATNKVRDLWRSRRHQASRQEVGVAGLGSDELHDGRGGAAPDEGLLRSERDEAIRRAIEDLPDGMRLTVHLRVYEELSFEEIGRILERNEVAVRKRYSRALEQLRESLGSSVGPGPEGPP